MSCEYSEDNLIERTAIEIFYNDLNWDIVIAFNSETTDHPAGTTAEKSH